MGARVGDWDTFEIVGQGLSLDGGAEPGTNCPGAGRQCTAIREVDVQGPLEGD